MIKLLRTFSIAAALLLAACSLQSAAPEKTTYQFGASRPPQAAVTNTRFGILRVADFRADQANRTSSLLYRETDQRFVADPYQLFIAPPATLLTERSRTWLASSGLFRSVLPSGALLTADTTLEGELVELYADVRDPKHPAAVLSLRAWLVNAKGTADMPQWRFSQRVPLVNADAGTVVAGFDQALSAALTDLEKALNQ
ncbi:MAG: hypothetical protein P4L87_24870 [Formivibrio sp.]|nr:hypothetical protein [Formivibrio sp.]